MKPMLHHTVLFRLRSGVTQAQKEQLIGRIEAVAAQIALHEYYVVGDNIAPRHGGYTVCLHSGFADAATLQRYIEHPLHVALLREDIEPVCEDRIASDLWG